MFFLTIPFFYYSFEFHLILLQINRNIPGVPAAKSAFGYVRCKDIFHQRRNSSFAKSKLTKHNVLCVVFINDRKSYILVHLYGIVLFLNS